MICRHASLQDSRLSGVSFVSLDICSLLFGKIQEHPGTTNDQFGGSWGLQGPFGVEVATSIQEIQQSWKSTL